MPRHQLPNCFCTPWASGACTATLKKVWTRVAALITFGCSQPSQYLCWSLRASTSWTWPRPQRRPCKEVGIRKSIGSRRKELIAQFLGESVAITAFRFVLAIALVELLLPAYNLLVDKTFRLITPTPLFGVLPFRSSWLLDCLRAVIRHSTYLVFNLWESIERQSGHR